MVFAYQIKMVFEQWQYDVFHNHNMYDFLYYYVNKLYVCSVIYLNKLTCTLRLCILCLSTYSGSWLGGDFILTFVQSISPITPGIPVKWSKSTLALCLPLSKPYQNVWISLHKDYPVCPVKGTTWMPLNKGFLNTPQ